MAPRSQAPLAATKRRAAPAQVVESESDEEEVVADQLELSGDEDSDAELYSDSADEEDDGSEGDEEDDEEDSEDDDEDDDVDTATGDFDSADDSDEERELNELLRKEDPAAAGEEAEEADGKLRWGPAFPFLKSTEDDEEEPSDLSDEEHTTNPVGRIPLKWYADLPHIGYDVDGKQIVKPLTTPDQLDTFLNKMENDSSYWRTVKDKYGNELELSPEELALVERITQGQFPDESFNPYEDSIDFFTGEKSIHPVTNAPEPKRRFIPSKWEGEKIMKLVRAIKKGLIKPRGSDAKPRFYNIWESEGNPMSQNAMHIPAPKVRLPVHDESYNPPEEYLWSQEEIDAWKATDVADRRQNYIPQKYASLRQVPAYPRFVQERFERCLDLYLCPRTRKNRLQIDPESLIPKLPKPRELQPFPTMESLQYVGHEGYVRVLSVDPTGQWLATGADDKTVRVWEVTTARCCHVITLPEGPSALSWNPASSLSMLSIAAGNVVYIWIPNVATEATLQASEALLEGGLTRVASAGGEENPDKLAVKWERATEEQWATGLRVVLRHSKAVAHVSWHRKGDYIATLCPDGQSRAVAIHQLSKGQSQTPFRKSLGIVQRVLFHPTKPHLFVATQKYVRVYNLVKQSLEKKLQSGVKWISSMDVHPKGDNVIIGSYDRRVCWFDMDLSTRPYRTLRYHTQAVRNVCYHARYPLFASASDDGSVHVFHGRVFADLLQNPLVVPVKILRGHAVKDRLGVLDLAFHPHEPWVFSCGADSTVRLFV